MSGPVQGQASGSATRQFRHAARSGRVVWSGVRRAPVPDCAMHFTCTSSCLAIPLGLVVIIWNLTVPSAYCPTTRFQRLGKCNVFA